jgi:type IV pilus assembly protein PilV
MLEVLVSLFVLSIGLLGLAALQTVGLQYNRQSYQRTQAVLQAYDILDRIRANPVGATNGDYNNVALGNIPSVSTDCTSSSCTPDQMATYDINQWNTMNAALLTSGRGAVCHGTFNASFTSCTAGPLFSIAITWVESDMTQNAVIQAQL